MNLKHVTITGADDNTDLNEMVRLSGLYPLVEWGILISRARINSPRYPSSQRLAELSVLFHKHKMKFSLHLCGEITRDLMMGNSHDADTIIRTMLFPGASMRVQINFNSSMNPYDLEKILVWTQKLATSGFPRPCSIFQLNKANKTLCAEVANNGFEDNHFLYDSSGGRGTVIANFGPAIEGHMTGYAGGLNPQNVGVALGAINETIGDDTPTWIDTESGVRTDNKLDMSKVEEFLRIAHLHAK